MMFLDQAFLIILEISKENFCSLLNLEKGLGMEYSLLDAFKYN